MFLRHKRIGKYTYVYLVESVYEDGPTRQHIIRFVTWADARMWKPAAISNAWRRRLRGSAARRWCCLPRRGARRRSSAAGASGRG